MSRIYFHSISGEREIWGAERALASRYIDKMALSILDVEENHKYFKKILTPGHYLDNPREGFEAHDMEIAMRVNSGNMFVLDNKPLDIWHVILNTAMAIGSNPIRLLTRLHAQCEIHAYIKGKNRKWLGEIIAEGLDSGIYRKEAGWNELISFLNSDDNNTVVTSYSVCTSFPNPYVLDYTGEDAWESFEKLGEEKQWENCLQEIYKNKSLEISPENLNVGFGAGMNAFELLKILWASEKTTE